MDDCYIVNDDLNKIVKYTVQFCKAADLPYYKKIQHTGLLRHLVIRRSATNGDLLVNLVTTTQNLEALDLDAYVKGLLELPLEGKIAGILHTENDSMADAVISDRTNLLYGTEYIRDSSRSSVQDIAVLILPDKYQERGETLRQGSFLCG